MDYFKVWEFHFESEKIYIFERRQGESVADLGKGLGGPASSPPLFFSGKKKNLQKEEKPAGQATKKNPPPQVKVVTLSFMMSIMYIVDRFLTTISFRFVMQVEVVCEWKHTFSFSCVHFTDMKDIGLVK